MSAYLEELETFERVAVDIARRAGSIINETCGKCKSIEAKLSFADLVTETDKTVEKFIFDELRKIFPKHKFIGEETVVEKDYDVVRLSDEPTWVVDPVDGTMNFVHTFPMVAVCLGLSIGKVPVLGVVYCPALDQMFTARHGNGSYCNGQRLSVRNSISLKDSLVATEIGSDRSEEKRKAVFQNLESVAWQCHGIRSLGSAAMNICAVAQGHFNAFYEFGLHCWDMCAPMVILVEAGGFVCDTTGSDEGDKFNLIKRRIIVACSEKIAKELSQALPAQIDLPYD